MRNLFMAALLLLWGCGGGGESAAGNGFGLIQFLESGKDQVSRNQTLTFRFSTAVQPNQDFFERLKIQNVQTAGGNSDFSRARGVYIVSGDTVMFVPALPVRPDRADAGFLDGGNYHVFLKGGPDALRSVGGDGIPRTQDFLFDTNDLFDDPVPESPPRALRLVARDVVSGAGSDISRLDSQRDRQAQIPSSAVVAAGNAVDPGAGGAPNYATPWQFELHVTEPLDPQSVNTDTVNMFEIANNSVNGAETQVNHKVPLRVDVSQSIAQNSL